MERPCDELEVVMEGLSDRGKVGTTVGIIVDVGVGISDGRTNNVGLFVEGFREGVIDGFNESVILGSKVGE